MIDRVLIVKLAAIGDVVMALPMIKALRKKYPSIKITWLCGKTVAPLLRKIGGIDEIIEIDDSKLLTGNFFKKLYVLAGVWLKFFGRRFDLVLTGHANSRYRLLSFSVRAKCRRSFFRNKNGSWPIPGRHHSDEYVRLATGDTGPITSSAILPIVSWSLPENILGRLQASPYSSIIALAPGGAKNLLHEDAIRRWPLENYVSLTKKLIDEGYRVILTGAPSDEWVCESFAGLPIVDRVGKTDLVNLVALYGACDIIVTHDSGPLHLAGLTGKSLVALFGPTNPFEKIPHDRNTKIIWGGEKLACRPCYDGRNYTDCKDNNCLKSIKVDDVYMAIHNILEKSVKYKHPE